MTRGAEEDEESVAAAVAGSSVTIVGISATSCCLLVLLPVSLVLFLVGCQVTGPSPQSSHSGLSFLAIQQTLSDPSWFHGVRSVLSPSYQPLSHVLGCGGAESSSRSADSWSRLQTASLEETPPTPVSTCCSETFPIPTNAPTRKLQTVRTRWNSCTG